MQSPHQPHPQAYRGMQIHAVPESDRALDSTGRKLPWGYDADPALSSTLENRRETVEKGPFGRSQRRSRSGLSRSRSRTAEPRREEDRIKAEQLASEDAVFGSLRRKGGGKGDGAGAGEDGGGKREALGEIDGNAVVAGQQAQAAAAGSGGTREKGELEATEVMLYGFGEELQWAALDFYEKVSGGSILEDYDRAPPGPRNDISTSLRRAPSSRSLSKAALRKKNTFAGGNHWIKITFDSRGAAELACARSPHIVKGYLVYAEPYQGRGGPGRDEAIPASQAGAQISDSLIPSTFSTQNAGGGIEGSPNGSSTTATSATATARQETSSQPRLTWSATTQIMPQTPIQVPTTHARSSTLSTHQPQTPANTALRQRGSTATPGRPFIEGTTPIPVHPASAAILPRQPKQSWAQWLGASEIIGSTVPRRDDGSVDWQRAGIYWRVFGWLDSWLGTDFLGVRGE